MAEQSRPRPRGAALFGARGERAEWEVTLRVSRHLLLDERMIPTGESEPLEQRRFALDGGSWDDAFAGVCAPPVFELAAADTRIELELAHGYRYAQLYAPDGERFACFEPMTTPTNALRSGEGLTRLAAGESFAAAFAIGVDQRAGSYGRTSVKGQR